jgi:hypothetical protein
MCNVFLHRIDRVWDEREHGVLVRFADDAVVMCRSRRQAEAALERLRVLSAELGLEPKEAKTRIVHLEVGGEAWISWAFIIGGCVRKDAPAAKGWNSSLAGLRTGQCDMRVIAFGN